MSASPAETSFVHPLAYREPSPDMPVPNALNLCLVAVVFAAAVFLLWLGSHVEPWYAVLGVGVVFSYLLLTNYALFHEAAHGNLHSNPRINRLLGVVPGLLFPMPFSMFRVTHQGHHLRNRTDHEMFDLYYPTDSKIVRFIQWYGILFGFFWPWVPLGAVLFAVCPGVLRTRIFRRAGRPAICSATSATSRSAPSGSRFSSRSRSLPCCSGCCNCAGNPY